MCFWLILMYAKTVSMELTLFEDRLINFVPVFLYSVNQWDSVPKLRSTKSGIQILKTRVEQGEDILSM